MIEIELIPIKERLEDNGEFLNHPECKGPLEMTILFYAKVGYRIPWIGYYARSKGEFVGVAGFKGKPVDGKVEIAYGTFEGFQNAGLGTEICRQLVVLARETDPSVRILARTLPRENYSTKVLRKNGFRCLGKVVDPDDGKVWEWEFVLPV